jgi:oligoendopeptidase F
MSMEFFAWRWINLFFDNPDKYRYGHLDHCLSFIPYGSIVDEFQHIIYANPNLTPAERHEEYKKLEAKYRPYLETHGIPFIEEGRRWQYQMHIYERPFYYIDYCLAQTVALNFWALSQDDYKAAWETYMRYTKQGGRKVFTGLLEGAGLPSPFGEGMLAGIAERAVGWLGQNEVC